MAEKLTIDVGEMLFPGLSAKLAGVTDEQIKAAEPSKYASGSERDERVVGSLATESNEDLRRLRAFTVNSGVERRRTMMNRMADLTRLMGEADDRDGRESVTEQSLSFITEVERSGQSLSHLSSVFWYALRERLDVQDAEGIGLRSGWEVVTFKSEESSSVSVVEMLGTPALLLSSLVR